VEVLYATEDGTPAADLRQQVFHILTGREPAPGEAARVLRAWTGEAAVEHLLLVACGLDSAQTGEHEIAAQLRSAWEDSRAADTCGPILDRLMGEAFGMARRMRRLSAGLDTPSLADLATDRVLQHLDGAQEPVALLGVSAMTRRCAAALHAAHVPLIIVNRTLASAEELAADLSGQALALEAFRLQPPTVSALVLAAGGGTELLDEAAQSRRLAQLVRLAPVRAAIDERLTRLRTELAVRAIGPRLARLRETFEQMAAAEVARALKGELRTLDARERAQLERLAATLAHRLAHLPLAGLRAAAAHAGSEAVEAFFDGARAPRERAVDGGDTGDL
jgi:glutamyl-tRNA reductase